MAYYKLISCVFFLGVIRDIYSANQSKDVTVNITLQLSTTNCSNETVCIWKEMSDSYGLEGWVQPTMLLLYAGAFVLALGGNLLILLTILRRKQGNVTNIFIGSLCISDILVTLICVPTTVVSNLIFFYWPFWGFLCPLVMFLQVLTVLQRSFTLLAMTLDKHYVVTKPFRRRLKRKYVKITMLGIWLISACIAVPVYHAAKIQYLEYEPGSKGLCMESWDDEVTASRYSYSLFVIQYMLPLVVMAICYTHIAYIIWVKRPPGEGLRDRDKRIELSKRKAVKMLMSVVFVYAVCWLPLHVLTLVGQEDPTIFNNNLVHFTWLFSHWLAISNSGVNPVVYLWMNAGYRRGIKDMFVSCTVDKWSYSPRKTRYTSVKSVPMPLITSNEKGTCCQIVVSRCNNCECSAVKGSVAI